MGRGDGVNERTENNARLLVFLPALFGWAMLTYALAKHVVVDVHGEGGHDFRYFYLVASMLRDGIDYTSLAPERFTELARHYLGGASYPADAPYVVYHAPTLFIAFIPLTCLSPAHAAALWGVISFMLYLGGVALLIRTLLEHVSWRSHERPLLVAAGWFVASVYYPFQLGFHLGQVEVILFALVAASCWAMSRQRMFLSGVCAGMLCCVKPATVFLLPFWAARRMSLPGIAVVGAVSLAWLISVQGWPFLEHYLAGAARTANYFFESKVMNNENISLLATLGRAFHLTGEGNDVLRHVSLGMEALSVLAVTLLGWKGFRDNAVMVYFPVAICVWLLSLPQIEVTYLVMALAPAVMLIARFDRLSERETWAALVAILVLALPFSVDRFQLFQSGPLALVKSARVFALIVIAWALWSLARREHDGSAADVGADR